MNSKTQLAEAGSSTVARGDGTSTPKGPAIVPTVDIHEDGRGITLWADLPGVSKERLNVHVQDGNLFIEGEASIDTPASLRLQHAEVREPRYVRALSLSADFDVSKIDANLYDGVLKLSIPRREEARPRRIEVNVG